MDAMRRETSVSSVSYSVNGQAGERAEAGERQLELGGPARQNAQKRPGQKEKQTKRHQKRMDS